MDKILKYAVKEAEDKYGKFPEQTVFFFLSYFVMVTLMLPIQLTTIYR